ncbi:MAG: hypothetical protein KF789_10475 [Bdellovibrionaceae bacterium]|nr:hypothetical protein [Pseudobdellovibrionaceae bacterium]
MVPALPIHGAGVDKLEALFPAPLSAPEVVQRARDLGFCLETTFLKERAPFLKVSKGEEYVLLKYSWDKQTLGRLVSNPNRFRTWGAYRDFLSRLLTPTGLESAKISRLDLNLDFSCPFPDLIRSLHIKNKRAGVQFTDDSGERTGINIGKAAEVIQIYDKARQAALSAHRSRIELRMRGHKLPTFKIASIPSAIQTQNFFETVEGLEVTILGSKVTETQKQRIAEFQTILNRDGFYFAKKALNKDRNFERDFGKIVMVRPWSTQPSSLFKEQIKSFFKNDMRALNLMQH